MKNLKPNKGIISNDDHLITVCSECLRASCWQGEFYCDEFQNAGTIEKTKAELEKLNLENPDYWGNEN